MNQLVVLVPVLRRPQRVKPFLDSLAYATHTDYRVLFIADSDDDAEIAAIERAGAEHMTLDPPVTWPQKINRAFAATTEPFLFLAADDLKFHPGWLPRAFSKMEPGIGIVGTNDMANPRVMCGKHATHMLVRRAYIDEHGVIDEPGKVVHEGYFLDYADDELVQTAQKRGAYAHAFDSLVEHLHPIVGDRPDRLPDDDTYRSGRERVRHGRRLYRQRLPLWR